MNITNIDGPSCKVVDTLKLIPSRNTDTITLSAVILDRNFQSESTQKSGPCRFLSHQYTQSTEGIYCSPDEKLACSKHNSTASRPYASIKYCRPIESVTSTK
jgi:hypothetical protein